MFGGFGAGAHIQRYLREKEVGKSLPTVAVTVAELEEALVLDGMQPEKAKFQAMIAKNLGSSIRVGDKLLEVKADDEPKPADPKPKKKPTTKKKPQNKKKRS